MSSAWKTIGPEEAERHPLYGIKGWLLVFLIGNFIGPLMNLGQVNAEAMRYQMSIGQFLSIEGPEVSFLKAALFMEAAVAVITVILMFTKSQHFRLITIVGRLAFWPTLILVALFLGISENTMSLLRIFFPWAISCAVWVSYLQLSKRVRVTFEHCVHTDELQPSPEAAPSSSSRTDPVTMPPSAQTLLMPTNDRPIARQQNETNHPVRANQQAAPLAQNTSNTAITLPPTMTTESSTEEDHWAEAMAEVESGQRRPGVWAKAFAESEGDETKAKVAYLKARVQQLTDAVRTLKAKDEAEKQEEILKAQAAVRADEEALEQSIRQFLASGTVSLGQIRRLVQHPDKARIVNLTDSVRGNTLLHICAESDMIEEVNALLISGADPQIPNNRGLRPEYVTDNEIVKKLCRGLQVSVDQLQSLIRPPIGLCPNCGEVMLVTDHTCPECKAVFGPMSAWSVKVLSDAEMLQEVRSAYLNGKKPTKNQIKYLVAAAAGDKSLISMADHQEYGATLLHWCTHFDLMAEAKILLNKGARADAKTGDLR